MEQARIKDTISPVIEAVILNLGEIFFFPLFYLNCVGLANPDMGDF